MRAIVPGRSKRGLYRSNTQPATMGMKMPRHWLGTSTTVTYRGGMPNPFSTKMGTNVMVASMEK